MKAPMPHIVANMPLKTRLCNDVINGKLSHAYIIEGADGSGKELLAQSIAAAVACEHLSDDGYPLPCLECENCRKILNRLSPDVIYVRREDGKAQLGVEASRFIKEDVAIIPNELDVKVYIIEDADKMTVQAQNTLLLTLEEPPRYALFILLCENSGMLLETVRSRAPILRTEPIGAAEMLDHLHRRNDVSDIDRISETELNEIVMASNGSIGKALDLLKPDNRASMLEYRSTVRTFVSTMLGVRSGGARAELIHLLPTKREELQPLLSGFELALRDLLLLKKSESAPLCFYHDRDEALALSDKRSAPFILKIYEGCVNADEALSHNANVKLTVVELITCDG